MNTITISNRKGGSAKTTTAINLSAELAKNYRVLLVDFDTQGHASLGFGVESPDGGGSHVIFQGGMLAQTLMPTKLPNLTISPASKEFDMCEITSGNSALKNAIESEGLEGFFDFCIIDTAPTHDLVLKSALEASNCVVVPVITQPLGVDGVSQMFRAIYKSRVQSDSGIKFVGVLPVMYNPHIKEHVESLKALLELVGREKIFTPIGVDISLSSQFSKKEPVVLTQRRTKGSQEYKNFTQELLARNGWL